jgi:3-hydroxyisobutyrate dehydrogenase
VSVDTIKRVCFVGIGNMGWPMAERLVRAGFEVAVTDAVSGRARAFVDQGAVRQLQA